MTNERVGDATAAIQAALDEELEKMTELTKQLSDVKDRVVRYQRAISALQEPDGKPKKKGQKARWGVSEKMLDRLIAVVEEQFDDDQDFTVRDLADAAGVAHETAKQGIEVMRERQMVRIKSAASPGKPLLARRMPA